MWLANTPLVLTWMWFALRARKLFFFSAVNPVIETGGMWGESKWGILQRLPKTHQPLGFFVEKGTSPVIVQGKIKAMGMNFPVIAKPDVGERGTLVAKIKTGTALIGYMQANQMDFIIQDFVSLPVELSVMYHRFPGQKTGKVTSICVKETLKVTGDGQSTVRELMAGSVRASFQLERFEIKFPKLLQRVPAAGEQIELEPIGNHCRGTKFLNGNAEIDEALTRQFDKVAVQMDGIHYGRFDLKCRSIDDLRRTGRFLIIEFNGIGAEPAHIYDPSYPIWKKYRDIYQHWRIIFRIYRQQRALGHRGMSVREVVERVRAYRAYQRSLKK